MISVASFVLLHALGGPPTPRFGATLSLSAPAATQATPNNTVSGTVQDAAGGVIPGATVVVRVASGAEQQVITEPDGRFSFNVIGTGDIVLIVKARGFADARQTLAAGS